MTDLGFLDGLVFLAIDAGSERAGACLGNRKGSLASGRKDIRAYTREQGRDPDNVWSRVEMFSVWVSGLLYQYRPDFLVMELPTGDHDNRHTDRIMGALLGILITKAQENDNKRVVCTPQEVRAVVTEFFPGDSFDKMVDSANKEGKKTQATLIKLLRQGEWLWTDSQWGDM